MSLDPQAQAEIDRAWNEAFRTAQRIWADLWAETLARPELADLPTWDDLAPYYRDAA